mmetsp:Transcript_13673/g.48248  ORF Transcript_13673/g.48248 Transcript_13673/m.48248 type:complete len:487 (-) Transcript_13673:153-1613(-)
MTIRFLRLLRLTRLVRIMKLKGLLSSVEEVVEANLTVQFALGLAKLLGALFVTTHWAACFWWSVGTGAKAAGQMSWVDPYVDVYHGLRERYVWSLYFTLTTMTTVGYGDITPVNYDEALFALVLLPVASVLFATLMGSLTDLISNLNAKSRIRQKKKNMLSLYLAWRNVSPNLKRQIRNSLIYSWDEKHDFEVYEEEVKGQLPSTLRDELCLHSYGRLLKNAPFLKFMKGFSMCMRQLASMLHSIYLEHNDHLFKVSMSQASSGSTRKVTSVLPEAVTDHLVSAFRDARHSRLDNAQKTGRYNLYKPPALASAAAQLQELDERVNTIVLRLQRNWRARKGRRVDDPPGLARSSSSLGAVGPSRKARQNSYVPWKHMSSHLAHAPTYLGESCLWSAPYEKWESVQIQYTYNARCEHRAEIVVIPREALSNILTCFSPWLPERFEYFRGAVVKSMTRYMEHWTKLPGAVGGRPTHVTEEDLVVAFASG